MKRFNMPPSSAPRIRSFIGDMGEGVAILAMALALGYALTFLFPSGPEDLKADRLDINTTRIEKNQP